MKSSKEYRSLAAECLRLAGTTDDANSYAQYTALAEMWTALADEAETAIFAEAQGASKASNNRRSPRSRKAISDRLLRIGQGQTATMKIVLENSTAIVTYLNNGHLLHTDRTSGQLYRSRG